jgi:DNA sulfur modification protein DndC
MRTMEQPPTTIIEEYSVFNNKSIKDLHREIQEVYSLNNLPWVIGYSGGKDSTTAVQLVWNALKELPREKLTKPVYVISSDTLVETPKIVDYINRNIELINKAAKEQGLPFSAQKVSPQVKDTFWVSLIGKGYPAPTTDFRWCTDRMKIQPTNRFVMEKVAEFGEVVIVLGVRKGESATRDQVMNLHKVENSRLSRHSALARAFVFTPIEDFTYDDVWLYLLQVDSPWGNDNQQLSALYRSAQDGECPLVIDNKTQSCGNSRFGCWTCTVITKDKSMTNLIQNGEEWMTPLLQFRNELAKTQDPAKKGDYREHKRRDGRVKYKADGSIIWGPYKLEFRKQLLTQLLETQRKITATPEGRDMELITPAELHEIRRLWLTEERDWEDSVPKIVQEVLDKTLDWVKDDIGIFKSRDKEMLAALCQEEDVPDGLMTKLLEVARQSQGMNRRASVQNRIKSALGEDWRTRQEAMDGKSGLLGATADSSRNNLVAQGRVRRSETPPEINLG